MSDYKTIERELLGIGQAEMQNIVFQMLDKQYTPTNIVNLGSASGVQTTRYGTPDVFLQLSNENYIYAEVSFLTQTNITTENISYITWIRERRSKIVEYKKKARLRELSDYRFYS